MLQGNKRILSLTWDDEVEDQPRPRQKTVSMAGLCSRDLASRQVLTSRQGWEARGSREATSSQTSPRDMALKGSQGGQDLWQWV